jgi:hypothetical protein
LPDTERPLATAVSLSYSWVCDGRFGTKRTPQANFAKSPYESKSDVATMARHRLARIAFDSELR